MAFERPLFPRDRMTKKERVLATLNHQPVDRAALLEQLSYNPAVVADWTGKPVAGYAFTLDDVCEVCARSADIVMPPVAPKGTDTFTDAEGFTFRNDEWTAWRVARPFDDEDGAARWLEARLRRLRAEPFDSAAVRRDYHSHLRGLLAKLGGTQVLDYSFTGFCDVFDRMGLEIFTFFCLEHEDLLGEYMEVSTAREEARVRAVADAELAPVVLIPEDFSTHQGPIFPPAFLRRFHYPFVKRLADLWHSFGVKALYHSDGNYRPALPDLMATGVDGFYCLEPGCGMDVVEFRRRWPELVWAGGVDGVDLMERGTPAAVRAEVARHIRESDVLARGGMFVATSSEINPPIPAANYRSMVEAVDAERNPAFSQ